MENETGRRKKEGEEGVVVGERNGGMGNLDLRTKGLKSKNECECASNVVEEEEEVSWEHSDK